jgi:hypothetical protein
MSPHLGVTMSYLSQVIVYTLAVLGVLFKSTKTDSEGKPLYWKHTIPVLTTTGKVVLTLITLSSVVSIISAYRKSKDEADRTARAEASQLATNNQLSEVRGENRKLNELLNSVYAQAHLISEDQRTQFSSVLTEQKESGEGIVKRIDNSIDLLHRSTGELNRVVHPVTDVLVSFDAVPPKHHPTFVEYQDLLEQGMNRVDLNNLRKDTPVGRRVTNGEILELVILPESPLFPSQFKVVSQSLRVGIQIEFYNPPVEHRRLARLFGRHPDLAITASDDSLFVGQRQNTFLFYDLKNKWIHVITNSAKSDPATWERTENITSIPDLLGSQVVVKFFPLGSLLDKTQNESLADIVGQFELKSLTLRMSGGREFQFVRNMFTRHFDFNDRYLFVCDFSANRRQFER